MRIDKDRIFRKNNAILYKETDGAGVLIDPYRRTLLRLNPTASQIWYLIDGYRSPAAIVEALKAVFDAGDKELEKDVTCFLKDLLKREIIQ